MASADAEELAERRGELASVAEALQAVHGGGGRLVLVEGMAGIGKTALLVAARGMAERAGLAIFTARGAELEGDFGFGVMRQLFERRIGEDDREAFAGPAALAAPLLGLTPAGAQHYPPTPEEATSAVMRGLYLLTANLARRGPLALIVDDVHWADAASLRFLTYLAGRLERLGVLVLLALRPRGEAPATTTITALRQTPDAVLLRPAPLSEDAAGRLVRTAFPAAPPEVCRACHQVTQGNPFFLRELAGTLRAVGATRATDVLEIVPASVTETVAIRIASLPRPARELARATAVLGGQAVLLRHAATLAGLISETAAAADLLSAAGIVQAARPLSFVHPIVRAAVYGDIPAGHRAEWHARAARMLAAEDAPSEQTAAHLLATEPAGDVWVSERLEEAGRDALTHGAPEAAIAALRRALQEPPASTDRPALLIALGTAEMLALDLGPAVANLRRGIETLSDPDARLRAALLLAGLLAGAARIEEGIDVLEAVLTRTEGADPKLIGHVEGQLVSITKLDPTTRHRVAGLEARIRRRVDSGAKVGTAELSAVAVGMAQIGESARRTAELALRVLISFAGLGRRRAISPSITCPAS